MSDREENDKPPNVHYEGGIPVFDTRLDEVERKQGEAERRDSEYKRNQIALNKRLVVATAALVLATIGLGVLQVLYMHRQWKLTSDGLSKMGDQIWAAKDAAYASKKASDMAAQTLPQMQVQTRAQQEAAGAAKGAADTAAAQLELAERPWVSVSNPVVEEPLQVDNTGFASTTVAVTLKNVGNSPAKVWEQFKLVSSPQAYESLKTMCSQNPWQMWKRFPDSPSPGTVLFPNDPSPFAFIPSGQAATIGPKHYSIAFIDIVGCVVYKSFISDNIYYTGFDYETIARINQVPVFEVRFDQDGSIKAVPTGLDLTRFSEAGALEIPQQGIHLNSGFVGVFVK